MLSRESLKITLVAGYATSVEGSSVLFSNIIFGDLYLKRKTEHVFPSSLCLSRSVTYLGEGGVWQERSRALGLCLDGSHA